MLPKCLFLFTFRVRNVHVEVEKGQNCVYIVIECPPTVFFTLNYKQQDEKKIAGISMRLPTSARSLKIGGKDRKTTIKTSLKHHHLSDETEKVMKVVVFEGA